MPPATLSFNYLGQFDQTISEASLFAGLKWATSSRSPNQRRSHLLEIVCLILNGRLETAWSYAPTIHHRSTIEGLAHAFMDALTTIIARATSLEPTASLPSRPELNLSQDQLSRVLSEIRLGQNEVKHG
jgi:non-ribosomal peptide synthase protein (TIGR01720 family)